MNASTTHGAAGGWGTSAFTHRRAGGRCEAHIADESRTGGLLRLGRCTSYRVCWTHSIHLTNASWRAAHLVGIPSRLLRVCAFRRRRSAAYCTARSNQHVQRPRSSILLNGRDSPRSLGIITELEHGGDESRSPTPTTSRRSRLGLRRLNRCAAAGASVCRKRFGRP